jgi:hypothetical protein
MMLTQQVRVCGALAPCIPEGLAPTLFLHSHGAGLLQESGVIVGRRGARYQRAHNESESKTQVWFAGAATDAAAAEQCRQRKAAL